MHLNSPDILDRQKYVQANYSESGIGTKRKRKMDVLLHKRHFVAHTKHLETRWVRILV